MNHENRNCNSCKVRQRRTYQEKGELLAFPASSFVFRLRGIKQQYQLLSGPTAPAD
jgi:hypothetical protein